jgi:parallel beta-helix repeat protein
VNIPSGGGLQGPATILVNSEISHALFSQGENIILEGFRIEKTFADGSYTIGILVEHGKAIKISNLDISGLSARYGIHLVESEDFEINGCHIHDFMVNTTTDMIQDSPAGLRITRSKQGVVMGNRIERIEVGPAGRASISPLVPGYGPQGYQSDNITLQQSQQVVVSSNLLVTSGEGLDMLLSQNCTATNNIISDIWNQGIKMLGVSFCTITGNFLSDCHQGIGLTYHASFTAEASGNTISGNTLRNMGAAGTFGMISSQRDKVMPGGAHGVILSSTNGCRYNLISDNVVTDTQTQKTTESGVKTNGDATNLITDNVFTTQITLP